MASDQIKAVTLLARMCRRRMTPMLATNPGFDAGARARLEQLLRAHEPADAQEAGHRAAILEFVARHPDPFDRRTPEGHLTGSAFVIDGACRLLLHHHRRLGLWIQLGGHADGEREAYAVALREAREESGLDDLQAHPGLRLASGDPSLLDVDVHEIPARGGEPAHLHLDLRFLLVTGTPERITRDPAESHALEWVEMPEAHRRCERGMRRALARVEALCAR